MVWRASILSFNFKNIYFFSLYIIDFSLCTRFTLSDSSSWYRTYSIVFYNITLCTLSVAKASSHWKKHIFFISLSFWRLFLSWYFTTVFSPLFKGLCWLCLRKGVHLRVPSLFSLTLAIYRSLSFAHTLVCNQPLSEHDVSSPLLIFLSLIWLIIKHFWIWGHSCVPCHHVFSIWSRVVFTCSRFQEVRISLCVNVCGSACALQCGGYECVICVCVRELECVWVDEHSPLKSQLRYLTVAVTQLEVIFFARWTFLICPFFLDTFVMIYDFFNSLLTLTPKKCLDT